MSGERGAAARRAGVIAAGSGERLRAGTSAIKPLVEVSGRALIDRVLGSLSETAPASVSIIINEQSLAVRDHVRSADWPFDLQWIVETTPSSMHSFLRIVETLAHDGNPGPFIVSTVDTIAPRGAFAAFAESARLSDADVVLAVAPPGDDEKPLLVEVEDDGVTIRAIGAAVRSHGGSTGRKVFATSGYYAVRSTVLCEADAARAEGVPALRSFLERLLRRGYRIGAVCVSEGVDVDRAADVRAAEEFLRHCEA